MVSKVLPCVSNLHIVFLIPLEKSLRLFCEERGRRNHLKHFYVSISKIVILCSRGREMVEKVISTKKGPKGL